MKIVKFIVLLISMVFISGICFAGNVNTSADMTGLSEKQKLEILQQIENAKVEKTPEAESVVDPKEITEWLNVGKQVAGLVPILAENTMIAADKVLESTTGRILLSIVLVKMFWAKLVGIFFFTFGLAAWWHMFKKVFIIKDVVYAPHPNTILNWFGLRQKTVTRNNLDEIKELFNTVFFSWLFFVSGVVVMLGGIIGFCN